MFKLGLPRLIIVGYSPVYVAMSDAIKLVWPGYRYQDKKPLMTDTIENSVWQKSSQSDGSPHRGTTGREYEELPVAFKS